jgi:cell wall-associated NlpC family hydrolase
MPALVLPGCLALAACATTNAVPRPYPGAPSSPAVRPLSADAGGVPDRPPAAAADQPGDAPAAGDAAVGAAESLLGAPYRSGGADPDGFDCSGFVQYVFARAGVILPRSVREQWQAGTAVDRADVRRGDLVFFAIGGREASHVGIALDAETFVHAPSARGVVRVERLGAEYWSRRYAGARRVTETPPQTGSAPGGGPFAAWPTEGTAGTPGRHR